MNPYLVMNSQFVIAPANEQLDSVIQEKLDNKTKPLGSLGQLENLALKIARIQETLSPVISKPHCFVFAGDHGLTQQGISAFPQEVTAQMVLNFTASGAAINVLCQQHGIAFNVVNAGVATDLPKHPLLLDHCVKKGTENSYTGSAMSQNELDEASNSGAELISNKGESNTFIFGEMGIGNTASASLIMHLLTDVPLDACIGRGTGLDDEGLKQKLAILAHVAERHKEHAGNPLEVLRCVGGLEIVMMCGAMLACGEQKKLFLVDGFIATAAVLVASKITPNILDYCVFSHLSDEQGHRLMLEHLNATPLLQLSMRLGEGSGAATAFPLLQSAVALLNQMASFDSANVSTSNV